ncbi:hypothetical protein DPMN_031000 [Dreissena polymorpha]|uniref:Uncharacterized protein n=1 Tax=Dreissena polymorpha TaxID=45954 RepID=A0A9D4M037_DREPO|nr:hypothetical protein DPMN_031000 [Dreissena polymorpha]
MYIGNFLPCFSTDHKTNVFFHKTNVLPKFHGDWTKKNVTSREKDPPPPGGHVFFFLQIRTIFKLNRRIQDTNVLTKVHEDWAKNVFSRLFTCFTIYIRKNYSIPCRPFHILKNAPPTGGHVFRATGTIFELVLNIIGTNLLTKFHDDRQMPRPLDGHVFPPTGTIFELIQDIIGANHLTKFHDDRTINVASRVLTRENAPPPDIIRTNLLTKFHEDRRINVASRVHIWKNAPPPGGHVFQPTGIIF